MPMLAIQVTIHDYNQFSLAFHNAKPLRDFAGITSSRVFRNTENDKEILILNETADVAKALEVLTGQEMENGMREVSVILSPNLM
jgi:hypothetical protein